VIDVDWELASFCIGEPVSLADLELLHSNAIERRGKVFLPGFVFFQYPGLSRDCKPHQPVFEALKRHQVDLSELTGSPMNGYSEGIESPMNGYSEGIESPMNEYSEGIESPMNEYSEGIGNPMNEYSEGIESPTSRLSKPTRKRKGKGKGKGSEGGCRGKRGRRPMRVAAWEWGPRGKPGLSSWTQNRSKCRRRDNFSPPPVHQTHPHCSNAATPYHQTDKLPIPDALACPRTRRNTPAGISIPPKSSWGILRTQDYTPTTT
jgi:hypothetical protein